MRAPSMYAYALPSLPALKDSQAGFEVMLDRLAAPERLPGFSCIGDDSRA